MTPETHRYILGLARVHREQLEQLAVGLEIAVLHAREAAEEARARVAAARDVETRLETELAAVDPVGAAGIE